MTMANASAATLSAVRPSNRAIRNAFIVIVFVLGAYAEASGMIDSIFALWEDIVFLTRQHLVLVGVSWGLAIAAGVPFGVLLTRPRLRNVSESIMQAVNIGGTVPTLAVLALAMVIFGLGFWTSIFALWLYSLLPMVRNTYQGILAVPSHLHETAIGMGMTQQQVLWRLELPNALFVIFAGCRTALAINVGTVPLAFLIGGGGLGELIFTGIALDRTTMMLAGAIPTALLAVILDSLMGQLQYWLVPKGVNPLRGNP